MLCVPDRPLEEQKNSLKERELVFISSSRKRYLFLQCSPPSTFLFLPSVPLLNSLVESRLRLPTLFHYHPVPSLVPLVPTWFTGPLVVGTWHPSRKIFNLSIHIKNLSNNNFILFWGLSVLNCKTNNLRTFSTTILTPLPVSVRHLPQCPSKGVNAYLLSFSPRRTLGVSLRDTELVNRPGFCGDQNKGEY